MKKTLYIFCLFLMACPASLLGQSVRLDYDAEPLNDILLELTDQYKVQISVNPEIANKCLITIHQRFRSMDLAMAELGARCQLTFTKIGEIYTFYPMPESQRKEQPMPGIKPRPQFLYQGVVVDSQTGEPVPYAMMQFDTRGMVADESGRFSFKSFGQQEKGLFRSLGYGTTDTLLIPGAALKVRLTPELLELGEIEVVASQNQPLTHTGNRAGHIRFNNISNNLVPGLSDNLIFNNLRLYPGVMAAGEAITDFVIWGSYAGQNHVSFDGITLFNSWGINDDMGRVNPYMIRNVEVYKGGFNVPFGDRVGGVIQMEGTSGDLNKREWRASLTNQLGNVYVNLPVFGKTTLQLAGRKTVFDPFDLSAGFDETDDLIVPTYDYSDLNLKLVSTLSDYDKFEISALYSEDQYMGNLQNRGRRNIIQNLQLNSTQAGASFRYYRNWGKGGISRLETAYSQYEPTTSANYLLQIDQRPIGDTLRKYSWTNPIEELKIGLDHTLSATQKHQLKLSATYLRHDLSLRSNADERVIDDENSELSRISLYALDDFQWTNKIYLQLGLKADLINGGETYFQPRLTARYDINQHWNIHLGGGRYNQFISKNPVVDALSNRSEVWQLADGQSAPVLEAEHAVVGTSFNQKGLEVGIEAFYKETEGMRRFSFNRDRDVVLREFTSRTKGMELMTRKKVGPHELWASYTLMEVEETPAGRRDPPVFLAPQSQEHEIKAVAMFNFDPIQASVTTTYGSGFPNRVSLAEEASFAPYRRTDLAFQYRFNLPNVRLEAGFSVLNLFNQRNVRLNQTVNAPLTGRINTVGIPFTPTLYVNVGF